MDTLIVTSRKYTSDPKYVFKSCGTYIVVLEKLDDTITNESRSNILNPIYCKYRANKLKVILIINKLDQFDIIKEIQNTTYGKKITYETNKIVEEPDYNMDLDKVCTSGIHYFKTIEEAFYWKLLKMYPKYMRNFKDWLEKTI